MRMARYSASMITPVVSIEKIALMKVGMSYPATFNKA
jgi:hypothetical protein